MREIERWYKEQALLEASEMIKLEWSTEEWALLDVPSRSKVLAARARQMQKERSVVEYNSKNNKPPTRAQMRNVMIKILKHVEFCKGKDLNKCTYEEIEELYERWLRMNDDFNPMNSEKEAEWIKNEQKRKAEILENVRSKKQKLDEGMEREERMEVYLTVNDRQEQITPTPVSATQPVHDLKIITENGREVIEITRADGCRSTYVDFGSLLFFLSKEDLEQLWKVIDFRYGKHGPTGGLARFVWTSVKNMCQPNPVDKFWKEF